MRTALVVIAKNEDNYLKEWVDYNLELGFDEIFVFQNNWRYSRGDIDDPRVHLLELDGHRMQNPCYNDFIKRHNSEYDFVACFDCDEFLHIRNNVDFKTWLESYNNVPVVYIPWRLFGDNGHDFVEDGNYSCLERFTKCDDKLNPLGKAIINTKMTKDSVVYYNPHIVIKNQTETCLPQYVFPDKQVVTRPWQIKPDDMVKFSNQPAEIWHFRNKTYQECYDRKFNQDDAFHEASECDFHTQLEAFNKTFEEHNKNVIDVKELCEPVPVNCIEKSSESCKPLPRVGLVALAKDEDHYLKEWIDYNLELGFDDIFVFQNDWKYTGKPISDKRVHLLEYNGLQPQTRCYNEFLDLHGNEYDFLMFFDIDEFLYIKSKENIKEFLAHYVDRDAFFVNWRVFGDNGLDCVVNNGFSVKNRFTRCGRHLDPLGKPIINTKKLGNIVRFHNPHILVYKDNPIRELKFFDPTNTLRVTCGYIKDNEIDEPVELYHYKNKTVEEFMERKFNKTDVIYDWNHNTCKDKRNVIEQFRKYNYNEIENTTVKDNCRSLICCIANDDLNEWIRYHLHVGFDHVVVYQNNWRASIDDDLRDKVTLIEWDTNDKFAQSKAYNDCIERFADDYDWIAFFDMDEFLVIKTAESLNDWLFHYEMYDSVGVMWKYFGDSGITEYDGNRSFSRFTKCQKGTSIEFKTILNTRKVGKTQHMHICAHCTNNALVSNSTIAVDGETFLHRPDDANNHVDCDNMAWLAHFRCKTFDEWKVKFRRNSNGFASELSEYQDENLKKSFDKYNRNEETDTSVKDTIEKINKYRKLT